MIGRLQQVSNCRYRLIIETRSIEEWTRLLLYDKYVMKFLDSIRFTWNWRCWGRQALRNLLHIKHFFSLPPPPRPIGASDSSLDWRFLHSVCHLPPFLYFGVGCHALHVFIKGIADVFEAREKRGAGGKRQEDRVWPVRKGCASTTRSER